MLTVEAILQKIIKYQNIVLFLKDDSSYSRWSQNTCHKRADKWGADIEALNSLFSWKAYFFDSRPKFPCRRHRRVSLRLKLRSVRSVLLTGKGLET